MAEYTGPAEIIATNGEVLMKVRVDLESEAPNPPRPESWGGKMLPESGGRFSAWFEMMLADAITLRLPSGGTGIALVNERTVSLPQSAILEGSGPPPF